MSRRPSTLSYTRAQQGIERRLSKSSPKGPAVGGIGQSLIYLREKTIHATAADAEKDVKPVSWFKLLRFAKPSEILLLILGVIMASVNGLFVPVGLVLYGEFIALMIDRTVMTGTSTPVFTINLFGGGKTLTNATPEENRIQLIKDSQAFGIGCLTFCAVQLVAAAISVDLFNYAALKQINRIKEQLLEAVLRQDQTWYDLNTNLNFATKVTDDIGKYREGIAEKVAIVIYLVMSFIFAVIMSFFLGMELTLVILSCTPIIVLVTAVVAKIQSSLTTQELKAYSHAGIAAEEILSSIRTVVAFGGENIEIRRYSERLTPAKRTGIKKGFYSGLGNGLMWFTIYATYGFTFWYGVNLILKHRHLAEPVYTPAILLIIFFSILQGAQNLGLTAPHIEAMSTARASGASILNIIDRKPEIDSFSEEGEKPKIVGEMEFEDVYFSYPARPKVRVLNGLNLKINQGETVALVGPSGSGKTTVLHLIQRMYDPDSGYVTYSGHDLRGINVRHLRDHIAVVGQEPVLFAGSIRDNIRMSKPTCTDEEIVIACKQAYCDTFISNLPDGYNTMLGERGAQLSGGQKQRIAIARALVRKPTILILDEATSALDSHSEAMVQKALDAASLGRTTVVVSHRLNTILNATRIVYLDKGVLAEDGTHEELLKKKGLYYQLLLENQPSIAQVTVNKTPVEKRSLQIRTPESQARLQEVGEDEEPERTSIMDIHKKEEKEFVPTSWQILALCKDDKNIMIGGLIAAFAVGCSLPMFAVLFGETYGLLQSKDEDYVRQKTKFYSLMFCVVGVITGVGLFFQTYLFNITGVKLTARLRVAAYEAMLKQEMGWFDNPANGVGALSSRLALDAAAVQGATGTRIGALMQACSTIISGSVVSFYYSWKLTLISIISVPFVILSVVLEGRVLAAGLQDVRKAEERATTIATEAITNIKTVCALCGERAVIQRYRDATKEVKTTARKNLRWRGCVFGFGQTAPVGGYALALWYGGNLVANKEIPYKDVITISEALIFGAWMMGQALAFAPNFGAAISAAGRVMTLLNREPQIQSTKAPCVKEDYVANGSIDYANIKFRYPMRREDQVLKGLSLDIPAGKRIALVGPSGCGKSTLIQLLQRLYDPDHGKVYLDSYHIVADMRLTTLRRNLGIVSQEPVLFDRSIRENIAYGDNTREVSIEEIVYAAKRANVHKFIAALPNGYDTRIGARASQLSGGQKQRVAIARALVRDPRVLLLDEATSALDTHSEKVVQEALDAAAEGRTCLIIAHRLTTIRNADMIVVIDGGIVAESGTHEELINLQGLYARLYELQSGGGITP